MKYVAVLLLGIATGVLLGAALVFYNPFSSQEGVSPLYVSDQTPLVFNYPLVASNTIVYTNDGESRIEPHPPRVLQLWEPPIRQTEAIVTELRGAGNIPVGVGIKFVSRSERTRLLDAEALVDSVWHIYLSGKGTMMIQQTENFWDYLREIVVPAHWNASDNWKGTWTGTMTAGPGALGTGFVYGGSGEFANRAAEAVEARSATAYSAEHGPVAMQGRLTIEFPESDARATE